MRVRFLLPLLLFALVPSAHAQTGGAEAGAAQPGYASAAQGGVSVATRTGGLVGVRKTFTGRAGAGQLVTIERFDELQNGWSAIAHATARPDGTFSARWKPDRAGAARVRARVLAPTHPEAQAATAAPEIAITLFTRAKVTWYGPGFYGHKTACRKTMSKTLVGVAHKSLPCGTKVTFLYKGRTLTVPVVDRGPFANGAKWDLTYAAAQQLGFTATDTVGRLLP
jgi:hypothetical protein